MALCAIQTPNMLPKRTFIGFSNSTAARTMRLGELSALVKSSQMNINLNARLDLNYTIIKHKHKLERVFVWPNSGLKVRATQHPLNELCFAQITLGSRLHALLRCRFL